MSQFDTCLDRLLTHEGGYVNHPSDPGGETNWGVTVSVARASGYHGPMKDMPRSVAAGIYKAMYWNRLSGDLLPAPVAFQVFDAAVNHGVSTAAKWLQEAIGVPPDGSIGPKTIAAVTEMPGREVALLFNARRLQFYTDLPTWPQFGKGWARRVAENLKLAAKDAA